MDKVLQMIDVCDPEVGIEILVSSDMKKCWVNVDGICRFRGQFLIKDVTIVVDVEGKVIADAN